MGGIFKSTLHIKPSGSHDTVRPLILKVCYLNHLEEFEHIPKEWNFRRPARNAVDLTDKRGALPYSQDQMIKTTKISDVSVTNSIITTGKVEDTREKLRTTRRLDISFLTNRK
jgi:hypothetical protein